MVKDFLGSGVFQRNSILNVVWEGGERSKYRQYLF